MMRLFRNQHSQRYHNATNNIVNYISGNIEISLGTPIKISCGNPGGSTLRGLRFDDQSLAIYEHKKGLKNSSVVSTVTAPQNQMRRSDIVFKNTNAINPDAIAVVIGNNKYSHTDIPNVEYAANDAYAMKEYLIKTLGYRDGNIIFQMDNSKAEFVSF